jgi:hypothetical protein
LSGSIIFLSLTGQIYDPFVWVVLVCYGLCVGFLIGFFWILFFSEFDDGVSMTFFCVVTVMVCIDSFWFFDAVTLHNYSC